MTTKKTTYLIFIFISLFLFSCAQDEETEQHSFNQITLNFYEQFYPENRELVFHLQTLEEFPCSNFVIDTEIEKTNSYTEIFANNIQLPNSCINSIGPASKTINMGDSQAFSPSVSLWVNDHRHDFSYTINDKQIVVEQKQHFDDRLFFTRDTLWRVPANTIWGYLVLDEQERTDMINDLMQYFKSKGIYAMDLEDGDYYHFVMRNGNTYFNISRNEIQGFVLESEENLEFLVGLFREFLDDSDHEQAQIRLFSSCGDRFVM
ncbi:MAG: hypothetical protein ACLFQS_06730 [Bacteroidales bacterium]